MRRIAPVRLELPRPGDESEYAEANQPEPRAAGSSRWDATAVRIPHDAYDYGWHDAYRRAIA